MILSLLSILFILDLLLGMSLYFFYKKNISYEDLISDLTEERLILSRMQDEMRVLVQEVEIKSSKTINTVTKIAGEIEREVSQSRLTIEEGLAAVVDEVSNKIKPIIKQTEDHQNALELSCRRAEREKDLLQKISARMESLIKFFDDKIPYDVVLKDIETKKYDDARYLLTQGYPIEQIAKDLGLDRAEVELIQNVR